MRRYCAIIGVSWVSPLITPRLVRKFFLVERKFRRGGGNLFRNKNWPAGYIFTTRTRTTTKHRTSSRKIIFFGSNSQPQTRTEVNIVAAKKKATKKAGKKKK